MKLSKIQKEMLVAAMSHKEHRVYFTSRRAVDDLVEAGLVWHPSGLSMVWTLTAKGVSIGTELVTLLVMTGGQGE